VNAANDANCDNGLFCDGAETCDAALDCQAGTPPVIDDGVSCTDDSCDEVNDVVVNAVNDANCDNGLFCDGAETCDATLDCQAGTPPVLDDGVGCTDDSCDEANDVVVNAANDANCDNGLFCDGSETCDALLDCQAGAPPAIDDGVGCTDDSCDEVNDVVVNAANDANCDNGLFCDGAETCDAVLDCTAGASPCAAGEICNETVDICEPDLPLALPGPDRTIDITTSTVLGDTPAASGGTAPYTYSWTVDPAAGATLSSPTDPNPTLTGDAVGIYDATLVVTDSLPAASLPATVTITVVCPADLDLFNRVISGTEVFVALNDIWLGDELAPLRLVSGADVTFRAGAGLILRDGFFVEEGVTAALIVDPTIDPTTCN
jgi:hypothetical protein